MIARRFSLISQSRAQQARGGSCCASFTMLNIYYRTIRKWGDRPAYQGPANSSFRGPPTWCPTVYNARPSRFCASSTALGDRDGRVVSGIRSSSDATGASRAKAGIAVGGDRSRRTCSRRRTCRAPFPAAPKADAVNGRAEPIVTFNAA
jgi:hypothetical protein